MAASKMLQHFFFVKPDKIVRGKKVSLKMFEQNLTLKNHRKMVKLSETIRKVVLRENWKTENFEVQFNLKVQRYSYKRKITFLHKRVGLKIWSSNYELLYFGKNEQK